MEESFSSMENLIAKRLVQVGHITEREASGVSRKKKTESAEQREEVDQEPKPETKSLETINETVALTEPDFVRMEKNIAGFGFFTPSSKRIKNVPKVIKFTQTVDGSRVEAQVKISGNVEYGMPITADQDKYLAFQKIIERCKREHGEVVNPITFTTAELLALLGTSKNGNRYREVEEWLKVMNATFIESEGAVWLNGKKRFASDSFVIFQRVKRAGQELDDGSIADRNHVWLSDWYLENLNAHYLLPIEFETYRQLKNNIAKALIPLLQVWLYASREAGSFEKRYIELCQILNIREYQHKSKISEKLSPSLNELVVQGYLKAWEIVKTADGRDFKLIFRHGHKFYSDQRTLKQLSSQKGKRRENPLVEPQKKENRTDIPEKKKEATTAQNFASETISDKQSDSLPPDNLPSVMTADHLEAIRQLHIEYQVAYDKSVKLACENLEESLKQLEAFPFREIVPKNKAGFLIEAIEQKYSLPETYYAHQREREAVKIQAERLKQIDDCRYCDERGYRNVKSDRDVHFGLMHQCTHDSEIENQLEDQD
jgi:hypothetical protein